LVLDKQRTIEKMDDIFDEELFDVFEKNPTNNDGKAKKQMKFNDDSSESSDDEKSIEENDEKEPGELSGNLSNK